MIFIVYSCCVKSLLYNFRGHFGLVNPSSMLPIRGGGAAGGDIGESVFATCTTLLEKLPAPWPFFSWTHPESHDVIDSKGPSDM